MSERHETTSEWGKGMVARAAKFADENDLDASTTAVIMTAVVTSVMVVAHRDAVRRQGARTAA